MITQGILKEMFTYKDGKLFWKIRKAVCTIIGEEAGSTDIRGYCNISIDHKKYKTHRLIFLLHHGYLPEYIDHIDGNPTNNRIENLRECTAAQNQWNQKENTRNTSGIKGVAWHKRVKQWQARVCVSGVRHYLGYFRSPELAAKAVKEFREQYHGDFVNHGTHN
jgi:hypothetical protein